MSDSSLKEETFDLWVKKFGVRVLSGCLLPTAGAAVSFNTPLYNRFGTAGCLLPGISADGRWLLSASFAGGKVELPENFRFDEDGYLLTK